MSFYAVDWKNATTYAKLYKQDNCILDFGVLFSLFFFFPIYFIR